MDKTEFVHNLKNLKIIIGNGFDLYCGLRTKYSDFFMSQKGKNGYIKKWAEEYPRCFVTLLDNFGKPRDVYSAWNDNNDLKNLNFWDFFFFFVFQGPKNNDKWAWCDIETKILEWLSDEGDSACGGLNFNRVYSRLKKNLSIKGDLGLDDYLACVAYKRNNKTVFSSTENFFAFLLNELKLFEKAFGQYIHRQQYYCDESFGIIVPDRMYSYNSGLALERISSLQNIVSVDTFNYGDVMVKDIGELVHHINGDVNCPIFGIDSDAFRAPDPRYIFTKTSRRMELDMPSSEVPETRTFENVVVFGSALAPADYSYFFSIFDKLDIVNINSPSKVVFAYSVYDREKSEQIKMNLTKSIFQLFQEYSTYKGNSAHPNRLLDSLTAQGKVILFDIDISKHG